jgi:hypothetical protein
MAIFSLIGLAGAALFGGTACKPVEKKGSKR